MNNGGEEDLDIVVPPQRTMLSLIPSTIYIAKSTNYLMQILNWNKFASVALDCLRRLGHYFVGLE